MYKNIAYSSLCKLNIYFFVLKLQMWLSQKQSKIFSVWMTESNDMNDRQQEY